MVDGNGRALANATDNMPGMPGHGAWCDSVVRLRIEQPGSKTTFAGMGIQIGCIPPVHQEPCKNLHRLSCSLTSNTPFPPQGFGLAGRHRL